MKDGVSFVVPVHNGAAFVRETLEAILAQDDGRPMEVIVIDDRSRDGSAELLREFADHVAARHASPLHDPSPPLRILNGAGRGAAAAINTGVRAARWPIICQVDQDVVVQAGWMQRLTEALDDPQIAAAQGYYQRDPDAGVCARAMNLDLEQRYAAIDGGDTDQVCTGNAAYRASALRQVGLFDETFGYGYDNDISYRLRAAGYRLTICRNARSVHRWREGPAGYVVQQYGFGYGRIDLVAKHRHRVRGDAVSRGGMMAHPLLMAMALAALAGALAIAAVDGPWRPLAWMSAALACGLTLERLSAGIAAAWRFRDPAALIFPALHLARDLAWVAAMAMWSARRLRRLPSHPSHSMRPRLTAFAKAPAVKRFVTQQRQLRDAAARVAVRPRATSRLLCLIPAHNEAANLPAVIKELRASRRDVDILVVDDGSTDGTEALLAALDVRWLRFPERMGVGSAMRAGLRYAGRLGYEVVARVDGDGQHRPEDIGRLLVPVLEGCADVALGSRYAARASGGTGAARASGGTGAARASGGTGAARASGGTGAAPGWNHIVQSVLAVCLSALTRRRVTDPTSGFCVLGPRAIRVLAEHHPTGYAEAELRLFLSRNALSVVEVPVLPRPRFAGRTSLTAGRLTAAGARVALAMLIVPFRGRVGGSIGD